MNYINHLKLVTIHKRDQKSEFLFRKKSCKIGRKKT